MRKLLATLFVALSCFANQAAFAGPKVEFKTTMGNFVVELDDVKAPKTTANFFELCEEWFLQRHYFPSCY